jgi:hypothetical protein
MGSRRALTLMLLSVLTSAAIFYSGMNFGRGPWIINWRGDDDELSYRTSRLGSTSFYCRAVIHMMIQIEVRRSSGLR